MIRGFIIYIIYIYYFFLGRIILFTYSQTLNRQNDFLAVKSIEKFFEDFYDFYICKLKGFTLLKYKGCKSIDLFNFSIKIFYQFVWKIF